MEELGSRQPVSTPGRRAYWDDDPVYGCENCGEQFNEKDGKLWLEGEPPEEDAA